MAILLAGIVVMYVGQGPIIALGTDLVVGSPPPEKAGSAAAMSETSTELGLALGVAVLALVALRGGPPVAEPASGETAEVLGQT
ncbi:hypothetical protein [Streptosporangium minutum]|uniref:hypothetical protein n=1 Tax=Streptosporangium minutum TaxID=569862 RepID=UPI001A9875FF|nr:hypothetical protein [Streptosporangium minutum]